MHFLPVLVHFSCIQVAGYVPVLGTVHSFMNHYVLPVKIPLVKCSLKCTYLDDSSKKNNPCYAFVTIL